MAAARICCGFSVLIVFRIKREGANDCGCSSEYFRGFVQDGALHPLRSYRLRDH